MKKTTTITSIFILLIISPFVFAESGCFLHPESAFYCSDLTLEEAAIECSFYENCKIENSFFFEQSCSDKDTFTECRQGLCKSTCEQGLIGSCDGGIVPAGEESEWCSPGCCRFDFFNDEHCDYRGNKWLCEIEAKNKDVEEFSFDQTIGKFECHDICSGKLVLDVNKNLDLEMISEKDVVEKKVEVENIFETDPEVDEQIKDFTKLGVPKKKSWNALLFSIIILIVILGSYFLSKNKPLLAKIMGLLKIKKRPLEKKDLGKPILPKVFSPFLSSPRLRKIISSLRKKRKHKIKEYLREEFLIEHGLKPTKIIKDDVSHLKKLVSEYERKMKYHPKPLTKEEEQVFHNLEQVIDKLKERETKFKEKISFSGKFTDKKDVKELISRLRKIAKEDNK
jgi:hypothetical protein